MKVFGDVALTWPSFGGDGDADEHVIVATTNASWKFLCKATPDEYETVEISPKRADEPWVWKHDKSKVTCKVCLAVLAGAAVYRVPL